MQSCTESDDFATVKFLACGRVCACTRRIQVWESGPIGAVLVILKPLFSGMDCRVRDHLSSMGHSGSVNPRLPSLIKRRRVWLLGGFSFRYVSRCDRDDMRASCCFSLRALCAAFLGARFGPLFRLGWHQRLVARDRAVMAAFPRLAHHTHHTTVTLTRSN